MDDSRHFPHTSTDSDEERSALEVESSEDFPEGITSKKSLTHRPRNQARLHRGGLQSIPGGVEAPPSAHTATDPASADLQPFADQLIAIAEQLRTGAFTPTGAVQNASAKAAASGESLETRLDPLNREQQRKAFAEMARSAYARRRKRGAIFGDPELFGEPAWDILLDLYVAHIEDKAVSVSSACIGSAAPPTTGLRWLGILSEQGLVEREHDAQDQRRVLVRLTDKALDAMDEYFSSGVNLYGDRRKAQA